jgi:hypothetical protein
MQEKAMAPFKDTLLTNEERVKQLKEISLPAWEKAAKIAEELKSLNDIPASQKKKAEVMSEYINGRKNEIDIINHLSIENNTGLTIDLAVQREKIDSLVTILNGL